MPLSEAEKWLDHLGSCSPCYADFKRLQQAHQARRRRMVLAVAAGILLAAAVTGWALLHRRSENLMAQIAVLDLRDRSIARGAEPNPAEPPLEISRKVSRLKVYLPLGSGEGSYDIRITTANGDPVFASSADAVVNVGITSLQLDVKFPSTKLSPGVYFLKMRRTSSEWNSYRLRIR